MSSRPAGTITFLFVEIEPGAGTWERHPAGVRVAASRQEKILAAAISRHAGYLYTVEGHALRAAFHTSAQAVEAALEAQRELLGVDELGSNLCFGARMALSTGLAEEHGAAYRGPLLDRLAQLLLAAHAGQVLLAEATAVLVREHLPARARLVDLGPHRLKDQLRPERVFQLAGEGLPGDFPPLNTPSYHPHNLPVQPTPFVGREEEVAQVSAMLRRPGVRLATLTGFGGTGKTRLALRVAEELLDDFPDGVYFIPLASIADPLLVPTTIAGALGIKEEGARLPIETLKDALREKAMLLVLDNFEQITGARQVVAELSRAAPRLKMMITSRAILRLAGEREYAVPAMALPDRERLPPLEELTRYDAVRLFAQRAVARNPDFQLAADNASAVVEICHRLDGLPLAIELATARIRLLPPAAMLARLDNRLQLLTKGSADLPDRQRTLRAAIEWSYDLLRAPEQALFRRLAVFRGGFGLEAVEALCGQDPALAPYALDLLEELIDNSLVQQREGHDDEPRYAMLETVREYAALRLGESGERAELSRWHASYFLGLADQADAALIGPQQRAWLRRLEQEHDNMRGALGWARDGADLDTLLRLVVGLWRFWWTEGHYAEGRQWLETALRIVQARVGVADLVELAGSPGLRENTWYPMLTRALGAAGHLAFSQVDYAAARRHYQLCMLLHRESGNRNGLAAALGNLGSVASAQGDHETAAEFTEQALAIARELGNPSRLAVALDNVANVRSGQGDFAASERLYREAAALLRELGDGASLAVVLCNQGFAASNLGRIEAAAANYEESLRLERDLGNKRVIAANLEGVAGLAAELGRVERMVRLFAAAHALRTAIGAPLPASATLQPGPYLEAARAQLGAQAWQAAWHAGAGLGAEEALGEALMALELLRGDHAAAARYNAQVHALVGHAGAGGPSTPWPLLPLARAQWQRGRHQELRHIYEQLSALAEPAESAALAVQRSIVRGMLELAHERYEAAEEALLQASALQRQLPMTIPPASADLLLAHLYSLSGRPEAAAAALERVLVRSEESKSPALLLREGELIVPLLKLAFERGVRRDYAARLLAQLGHAVDAPAPVAAPPAESAPPGVELDPRPAPAPAPGPANGLLSPREIEVLHLLANGATRREIAAKLVIGEQTVKTHLLHIFRKLDVNSNVQAAARGRELGLI